MKKHQQPRDLPTKAEKTLTIAVAEALGIEHLAVIQLNRELSQGLLKLVPKAIAQAAQNKPDTRLLRLLCRYSSTSSRKFINEARAGLHEAAFHHAEGDAARLPREPLTSHGRLAVTDDRPAPSSGK
jgi:hypothetical protein